MEFYIGLSVISLLIFIFLICLYKCCKFLFNHIKRLFIIKNFESYAATLQYHMEKAYEIIHKDQILVFSLEATKLPDREYHKAHVDFIKLVIKLIGPNLTSEFIYLYGDEETFHFIIAEFFATRYDEDEIRKTTVNNVLENGELTPKDLI